MSSTLAIFGLHAGCRGCKLLILLSSSVYRRFFKPLISMSAALARALAAQAAAVVQTTAFRRRALQVAV
jgi:hypothetical protein